jgi:hypothetical protein
MALLYFSWQSCYFGMYPVPSDLSAVSIYLYENHPFIFSPLVCKVEAEAVDVFNDLYQYAFVNLPHFTHGLRSFYFSKLAALLEQLFSGFRAQLHGNPELEAFYTDLYHECLAQLSLDFKMSGNRASVEANTPPCSSLNPISIYNSLVSTGFARITFPHETISLLQAILAPEILHLVQMSDSGASRREDLSVNTGLSVRRALRVINDYYDESGATQAVSSYLGFQSAATGLSLEVGSKYSTWWQSPYVPSESSHDSLYIHNDESRTSIKSFVYLSNITSANGPFILYPAIHDLVGTPSPLQVLVGRRISIVGRLKRHNTFSIYSHKYHQPLACPLFRQHFASLPLSIRFSSHFGWDIVPDNPRYHLVRDSSISLLGPPGTGVIFNGFDVAHRALVEADTTHISLQIIHSAPVNIAAKVYRKAARAFSS